MSANRTRLAGPSPLCDAPFEGVNARLASTLARSEETLAAGVRPWGRKSEGRVFKIKFKIKRAGVGVRIVSALACRRKIVLVGGPSCVGSAW